MEMEIERKGGKKKGRKGGNKGKEMTPRFVLVCLVGQSCPTLCDPMDCTCKAPSSMEFPRLFPVSWLFPRDFPVSQGYCGGLPFPSPGDLPDPGTEPLHWQVGSLTTEPPGNPLARLFSTLSCSLLVACTQPRDQPEVIA